jgi:ubiquinone/menaquinone biosynthesis C-methylase UbiE
LEIGPGIGSQVPRYDKAKVAKVYGVEVNPLLHEALRGKVVEEKVEHMYEIVGCAAEDTATLLEHGIGPESIDCVISIQVLCSVPEPDMVARELWRLLKPGGELIVYEHVKSDDTVARVVQGRLTPTAREKQPGT